MLMRGKKSNRVWGILGLILAISLLHYFTPIYEPFSHELFARFYYLPIILGALWFGGIGGLIVSLSVTIVYLPYVLMYLAHGGALFWDQVLEVLLFNFAGPFVGILVDREHKVRERNQELQTLAVLGEATASLAHEIKNIVIPIRGFLHRAREVGPPEGKAASYLSIAEEESGRLEEMTKEMLAFSRQSPLQVDRVEIVSLLHEVIGSLEVEFQNKEIELICQCEEEAIHVHIDRERIRQSLINLLENALDASPQGAQVRLIARRNRKLLWIEVEDMGKGIPEEHQRQIFHPFFTTKPHGTGLGLAITRRIIQEHGGDIRVTSFSGQGTRFSLEIPIGKELAAH